jgi:SET domain-containing protein
VPQADERPTSTRREPSRIAGHGLHAVEPVSTGERIVHFAVPPQAADELGTINHSCDPNLHWADEHTLVTSRDIAAGEELTVDYATCVTDPDFVLYCHCETYRCRQVIEGSDWEIPQLRTRYAGRWHPAVQRRIDGSGR